MREILFRGKTLNTGKWVEGYYCKHPNQFVGFLEPYIFVPSYDAEKEIGSCTAYPIVQDTVQQFTGLFDRNGRKIFEGDIVQYSLMTCPENKQFGCVKFYAGEFYMESAFGEETFMSSLSDDDYTYEVIGNIVDNPELLEEE